MLYFQWLCKKKDGNEGAVPVGMLQETLPKVTASKMTMFHKRRNLILQPLPDIFTSGKFIKVYMTDLFLFARLNIPNVLISIAKKIFHIDFPSPCLMYQKRQMSLPVGYKNRRLGTTETSFQDSKPREKQISPTFSYFLINNALLYHFLADLLAHNKRMTEKSVFCEAWSPEMTSQSFPVSCFWSHGFVLYWRK